jgi:hypothetical protein
MLNEIRVAAICTVALLLVVGAAQKYGPPPYVALENGYVSVTVAPPATTPSGPIADRVSVDGIPFVRLIIPTEVTTPAPDVPGRPNFTRVFVAYAAPGDIVTASRRQEASLVFVDLKATPAKSTFKDDAIKVDSTHNHVLLENDRVRVVRIRFEQGESGPMVDKRPRVIIARTDSHATVTFPDGHSETRDMKAGTVSFGNAGRQATKNTGTTPLENIVVELKSKDSEKK